MLRQIANRTMLSPSRFAIDTFGKTRRAIPFGGGELEVWVQPSKPNEAASPELVVLKFPGMAGRAEWSGLSPLDHWADISGEVWAVNYPGFGGSSGKADVRHLAPVAERMWHSIRAAHPSAKILINGNSLGACLALFVAARFPVDALILRNPPPIRNLIREQRRYNWWNFGIGRLVANYFPEELDPIANAARSNSPALYVQSQFDTLVPCEFQNRIISAHRGPKQVFVVPNADHDATMDDDVEAAYAQSLLWLKRMMFESQRL
ncbi:MAG: alpha/beta fold hydrolase [Pirellulaceae bacterium]